LEVNDILATLFFKKCREIFWEEIRFRIYNFNYLRLRIVFSIRHNIDVVAVVIDNCCMFSVNQMLLHQQELLILFT